MFESTAPLAVRLDIADKVREAVWRTLLADFRLLSDSEAGEAEVLVTDRDGERPVTDCGVIGIGEVTADVVLPPDHLPRELTTAVRLLGEIVRLRRGGTNANSEWRRLALTDALTGLPNRRAWDERLARQTADDAAVSSLAILDLDDFKRVNDRFGHPAGDAVLRKAAAMFQTTIRARDFFARIGGDEFAVLLLNCRSDDAVAAADRIRSALAQATFVEAPDTTLTASAGVGSNFAAADAALRTAKAAGRDRTVGQVGNLP